MATTTLTAYTTNTLTQAFELQSTSETKTVWIATGREIACPYTVSVERKKASSNSPSNDHVVLRVTRIERNATTGKLATFQSSLDLSIPKDQSILSATEQKKAISWISSCLNEGTAMEATNANITKLIEGRDL